MANQDYDYIIVGAGSAGAVVANRLTEDPSIHVLLVEAGGRPDHPLQNLPLYFFEILKVKRMSWGYESEPEPQLAGRKLDLPRGKALGGSSTVNGMVYMRGHSVDFDTWRQMGCTGWSYADVLPYFKRMENFWGGAGKYHGAGGPVSISAVKAVPALHKRMMEAAQNAGIGTSSDIHGDVEHGFTRGDVTIDARGRRVSTYRAYLEPILNRPNLHIVEGALVTRVLLEGKRASGIEFRRGGVTEQAQARREVVLSAGSFNTPQLLMLSGIGPGAHLRELGIEVVQDLPGVGQNMSEHSSTGMAFSVNQPVTMLNELRIDRACWSMINWALFGRGQFTTQIIGCNAAIFTREGLSQPDMQLYYNPIRMDAGIWWPWPGRKMEHRFACAMILLHPLSRGWVKLRSSDPMDRPRIQPNLLSHPADMAAFVRGARIIRKLVRTPPQDEITDREISPGAAVESDADIEAWVRRTAATMYHPVGTCTMGISDQAVVDAELKVRGIQNLRVIDASIMPTVPGGNTNAPSMMIGEKGADLLRGRALPAEDVRGKERAA